MSCQGQKPPLDHGLPRAPLAVGAATSPGLLESPEGRTVPPAAADSGDHGYHGGTRGHRGAGAVEVRGRKLCPEAAWQTPFFWGGVTVPHCSSQARARTVPAHGRQSRDVAGHG